MRVASEGSCRFVLSEDRATVYLSVTHYKGYSVQPAQGAMQVRNPFYWSHDLAGRPARRLGPSLEGLRFYDLRSVAASAMVAAGVDVKQPTPMAPRWTAIRRPAVCSLSGLHRTCAMMSDQPPAYRSFFGPLTGPH